MLFLFTLILLVFASGATESSSISPLAILASSSPTSTVYSCFFDDNTEVSPRAAKETCCKGVTEVWQRDGNDNSTAGHTVPSIELRQRCMSEMAQVPPTISPTTTNAGNHDDTARYSWVVSKPSELLVESTSLEQHLWTFGDEDQLRKDPVQTVTPYHKTSIQQPTQNPSRSSSGIVASKLKSHLGRDGGMHRLFHHSFEPTIESGEDPIYFIYLVVPRGMFIDLDDPIEPAGGMMKSTPIEDSDGVSSDDTSHAFFVTTTTKQLETQESSVLSFRARLHAASICDIEQPSFVSGQHLLVWEIDRIVAAKGGAIPPVLNFSTKLHLRYPHPSSTLEEWIDLPSPLLFAVLDSESKASHNTILGREHDWSLDVAERVWVAAGKDEDHNWIMGMTITFCLVGVGIMLRDISRVSLWDDA